MKIEDNIIKHNLSHVYFLLGTGCAGKTTLAKYLSQKHNMYYYDSDVLCHEHKEISTKSNQPAMNIEHLGWEWYFNRSPLEYSQWLYDSIKEQLDFIIVDLLRLPNDRPIIVDAHCYTNAIQNISSYNRILYLTSGYDIAMEQFFNRDDKNDLYQLMKSLKDPDKVMENFYNTMELMHNKSYNYIINTGYKYHVRAKDTRIEDLAKFAEEHFSL